MYTLSNKRVGWNKTCGLEYWAKFENFGNLNFCYCPIFSTIYLYRRSKSRLSPDSKGPGEKRTLTLIKINS